MLKRFFQNKNWVIFVSALAVFMLVLLAMGLDNIHFQPGRPLAHGESRTIEVSVGKIAAQIVDIPIWKQLVFWGLVFILIAIVASFFSPELRKRILLYFLRLAVFVLALFYILTNFRDLFARLNLEGLAAPDARPASAPDSLPSVFTPPHVSNSLLYAASLAVILALAAILFFGGRWWLRRQRLDRETDSLVDLAEIARTSLAEISSGEDWQDAIVKAYARMSEVVGDRRGLKRRPDLTSAEFGARLQTAGLPAQAVQRLTHLFEMVRYGARPANREQVAEAVDCLTIILQACGVEK